ncbi:hypothetical protein [Aquabacter spiritensis]|uniref:hypothetical protein n=1 Tax=Aquabacter spiritensis TaxID=933073 RepID=UPI001051718D|nr:hypothetical protein [Aquabacter spiritensis]
MPDGGPSYDYPRAGYEQLLFKANAAGITVYSISIATLMAGKEVRIPLIAFLPLWLYFFGLLFGFFVYAISMQIVEDMWRRKKRKEALDLLEKTESIRTREPLLNNIYNEGVAAVELATSQLMTPEKKVELENNSAKIYIYSGYAFILGTLSALLCAMFAF